MSTMLKADGYRLFRLTVSANVKRGGPADAERVRQACVKKGLVLDARRNPAQPFRYREVKKNVYEFEQVQSYNGKHALAPPEQPEFLEQFLSGAPWLGVVKTAKL